MGRAVEAVSRTPAEAFAWIRIAREIREASPPGINVGALMGDVADTFVHLRLALNTMQDPETHGQLWQRAFDRIRDHIAAAVRPAGHDGDHV